MRYFQIHARFGTNIKRIRVVLFLDLWKISHAGQIIYRSQIIEIIQILIGRYEMLYRICTAQAPIREIPGMSYKIMQVGWTSWNQTQICGSAGVQRLRLVKSEFVTPPIQFGEGKIMKTTLKKKMRNQLFLNAKTTSTKRGPHKNKRIAKFTM